RDPPRSRKGVKAMLSRLRVGPTPKEIEDVVREVKVHHPKADVREMVRAFELAQVAHEGQLRKSGELFIEHPIGLARILARLGMDPTTLVGGVLPGAALAPAKREHVATETLEIYAPLADRLGMQPIRAELEDLAFKTLHAKPYEEIQQMVALRQPEREVYLQRVIDDVQARLREVRVR